ncbi:hypothetical protein Tco_1411056 [Tanacetum coccineum]
MLERKDSDGVANYGLLLGGHFKLSLKDFPVRDCDVERMSKADISVCGFVDSDYAKDPDTGRSITGYVFLVLGCVVSWKATLQYVVALSTTKAKYMALTETVKESIWLSGFLEELGMKLNTVAVLEAKMVKVLKVGTEHNAADTLTKVVPGLKLQHCLELLNVAMEILAANDKKGQTVLYMAFYADFSGIGLKNKPIVCDMGKRSRTFNWLKPLWHLYNLPVGLKVRNLKFIVVTVTVSVDCGIVRGLIYIDNVIEAKEMHQSWLDSRLFCSEIDALMISLLEEAFLALLYNSGGKCGMPAETMFYVPAKNRANPWYDNYSFFHMYLHFVTQVYIEHGALSVFEYEKLLTWSNLYYCSFVLIFVLKGRDVSDTIINSFLSDHRKHKRDENEDSSNSLDSFVRTIHVTAAIKSRFGGNEESKKMQKNVLKHQFENFVTASNETLDKAYE